MEGEGYLLGDPLEAMDPPLFTTHYEKSLSIVKDDRVKIKVTLEFQLNPK